MNGESRAMKTRLPMVSTSTQDLYQGTAPIDRDQVITAYQKAEAVSSIAAASAAGIPDWDMADESLRWAMAGACEAVVQHLRAAGAAA